MDEELKNALNNSGKELLEWANGAGSFVKEQAPLYVQELLAWQMRAATLWMWIGGIAFLLGVLLFVSGFVANMRDKDNFLSMRGEGRIGVGVVMILLGGGAFFCGLWEYQKAVYAPRVVIVDLLTQAAKGGRR